MSTRQQVKGLPQLSSRGAATSAEEHFSDHQKRSYTLPSIALPFLLVILELTCLAVLFHFNSQSVGSFLSLPPSLSSSSSTQQSNQSRNLETLDRLLYTLKLQVLPASVLALTILEVIFYRGYYPITRNPLSGYEHLVLKPVRTLTNTIEQIIFFELTIFIFAVAAERSQLFLIPSAVTAFTVGRVAFAVGYLIHPRYRMPGFACAFLSTLFLAGYNFFKVVLGVDFLSLVLGLT